MARNQGARVQLFLTYLEIPILNNLSELQGIDLSVYLYDVFRRLPDYPSKCKVAVTITKATFLDDFILL